MIYYQIAEGLGNIIQSTPAFNYLKKREEKIEIVCHEKFQQMARVVYKGKAEVAERKKKGIPIEKSIMVDGYNPVCKQSEVSMNLIKVGCGDPKAEDKRGFCGYTEYEKSYDILLCDGYNKNCQIENAWQVKSYLHWEKLSRMLNKEYRIASIGLAQEYISGSINETGIGIERTLGLIRHCKLLVSNDTGLYHAANVFGVRNLVIFTMTDKGKNYDPDFHKHTTIVSKEVVCQPCQFTKSPNNQKHYWIYNKAYCGWVCRDIEVDRVYRKVKELLP